MITCFIETLNLAFHLHIVRSVKQETDNDPVKRAEIKPVKAVIPLSFVSLVIWAIVSSTLIKACLIDSICFNNADCPQKFFCIHEGALTGRCLKECSNDKDCPDGYICERDSSNSSGSGSTCQLAACGKENPCGGGLSCVEDRCQTVRQIDIDAESADSSSDNPVLVFSCPEGMVSIDDQFCIDIYEASKVDATDKNSGSDTTRAVSRPNVLSWQVRSNEEAQHACEASGKTLCTSLQWEKACKGSKQTTYGYGNDYDPTVCDGIDKYCTCGDDSSCAGRELCPFPHCYVECGRQSALKQDPTGTNQACTNDYGVFDMNGNLWEHVYNGDSTTVRGGAYNCVDSEMLHRCDYVPGDWTPSALGFRCCAAGDFVEESKTDEQRDGTMEGE